MTAASLTESSNRAGFWRLINTGVIEA